MSYMLLIVEPAGQRAERDDAAGREAYATMMAYTQELQSRGVLEASNSLAGTDRAVRLQVREGRRTLIDGPFAESKEMVGGFFLLNVDTREQALALAAECPAAQWATVEVRQVAPCFE